MVSYAELSNQIHARYFEIKACGANKPGGGGFTSGNTCARGGSSPTLMHGTTYESAQKILEEGFNPGELGSVFATPDKKIAIEYGFSALVKSTTEEKSDAKFAVVVLKSDVKGFKTSNASSSGDTWQYTRAGKVPPSDIERIEVFSAWDKSKPTEVLKPKETKALEDKVKLYLVVLLLRK